MTDLTSDRGPTDDELQQIEYEEEQQPTDRYTLMLLHADLDTEAGDGETLLEY